MVIHDLYAVSVPVAPRKTNTKLVIDANAVLPFAIALQCLKVITRRSLQVLQHHGVIEHYQFSQRNALNI